VEDGCHLGGFSEKDEEIKRGRDRATKDGLEMVNF
jgi:hypothetical protein